MSEKIREELELEQSHFVQAMMGRLDIPRGFDQSRFKLASTILAKKRIKALKKAWPNLVDSLGSDFRSHFNKYASSISQPKFQSALVDGRLFANYLKRNNLLPGEVEIEIQRFDQRFFFKGKRIFERNKVQRFLYKLRLILK